MWDWPCHGVQNDLIIIMAGRAHSSQCPLLWESIGEVCGCYGPPGANLELQILLAWHCLHRSIFTSVLAFLLILQIYLCCSCSESTLNPNPNLTLILLSWPQANGSGLPGMWYRGISHEDLVCLLVCFLFVIRKGMRDCSTRCWSIMWRSSCQLCIHPL